MSIREHCADVWPAPGHRAQNAGLFGPAGLSPTASAQEAQPFDQLRRSPSPASSTGSWRTDPGRSRKQRHTAKRIYTRHGGVNDPAGLPAWRLGSTTAGASSWLCTAGAGMAKTTCPGERSQATVQRRGVIALRKQRCCLRSSTVGRRGPSCPPGYVRRSEHRLCEPRSPRLDHRRSWWTCTAKGCQEQGSAGLE